MAGFNLADYEPVEVRLARFWDEHPNGRVLTDLVHNGDGQYIVKAYLYRETDLDQPMSTGYAEELVSTRGVNQTSALENCETSAIGRALANAGYAPKGKRPSREEMQKVERNGEQLAKAIKQAVAAEREVPNTRPELSSQQTILKMALTERFPNDSMARKAFMENVLIRNVTGYSTVTPDEVTAIIEALAVRRD